MMLFLLRLRLAKIVTHELFKFVIGLAGEEFSFRLCKPLGNSAPELFILESWVCSFTDSTVLKKSLITFCKR